MCFLTPVPSRRRDPDDIVCRGMLSKSLMQWQPPYTSMMVRVFSAGLGVVGGGP